MREIAEDVKNSAYDIISKKQATYYGIAMSVKRICECVVRDEKSILPVSSIMHGNYGIKEIALSKNTPVAGGGNVSWRINLKTGTFPLKHWKRQ